MTHTSRATAHPLAQGFADHTDDVRAAVDAVLDEAERILELVDAAKQKLALCDRHVAKLRRAEDDIGQGRLNSVSAVQQGHRGLAAALEEFNQHTLRLFDIRRELSHLHPKVVATLLEPPAVTVVTEPDVDPAAQGPNKLELRAHAAAEAKP